MKTNHLDLCGRDVLYTIIMLQSLGEWSYQIRCMAGIGTWVSGRFLGQSAVMF